MTNNRLIIETEGKNVAQCLQECVSRYPQLYQEFFKKNGNLHNFLEIYHNQEYTFPEEHSKPVKDGDQIHITFMLSGG